MLLCWMKTSKELVSRPNCDLPKLLWWTKKLPSRQSAHQSAWFFCLPSSPDCNFLRYFKIFSCRTESSYILLGRLDTLKYVWTWWKCSTQKLVQRWNMKRKCIFQRSSRWNKKIRRSIMVPSETIHCQVLKWCSQDMSPPTLSPIIYHQVSHFFNIKLGFCFCRQR